MTGTLGTTHNNSNTTVRISVTQHFIEHEHIGEKRKGTFMRNIIRNFVLVLCYNLFKNTTKKDVSILISFLYNFIIAVLFSRKTSRNFVFISTQI